MRTVAFALMLVWMAVVVMPALWVYGMCEVQP